MDVGLKASKKAIHLIKVKVLKDYYRAMDSVKTIIQSLLDSAGDLTRPQQKFLLTSVFDFTYQLRSSNIYQSRSI